jgi:hypothetical protein
MGWYIPIKSGGVKLVLLRYRKSRAIQEVNKGNNKITELRSYIGTVSPVFKSQLCILLLYVCNTLYLIDDIFLYQEGD